MLLNLSDLDGPYLHDICDQPNALAATLDGLKPHKELSQLAAKLRRGAFDRIVLTGMGSSYFGLHPINLQLIERGWTPLMVETSELVHYQMKLMSKKTLVIAVSQSGRSAEVVRLLDANRKLSTILAITNTEDSPLAQQSDVTLLTRAGEEFSVSCKTYVASLLALEWLSALFCDCDPEATKDELRSAIPAVSGYLRDWKRHVSEIFPKVKGTEHMFLVGRGNSMAAVETGALIIKESDRFHAEGMSSAAFRHGPFEMLGADSFVVVFSGAEKTRQLHERLVEEIRARGVPCASVNGGEEAAVSAFHLPEGHESIRPILEILPVQMITLALAAAKGFEPGKFEYATKVTVVE